MVGDEHQIARLERRIHSTGSVCDDEGAHPELGHDADGQRDALHGQSLVGMHASLHHDYFPSRQVPEDQPA